MRKCLAIFFLLVCGVFVNADSLIGVEAKYHGYKAKEPVLGNKYTDGTAAVSARIGAQEDEYRAFISFDFIQDSDYRGANISQYMINVNLDYFIPVDSNRIKPFIGAILGYASYDFGGLEQTGMTYGAEAGFLVPLSKKIDVDLFARYMATEIDQVDYYIQSGIGIQYKF